MAEGTGIDDLPESIVIHILSFLPTIDARRSSSVSRKWRNLWKHVSALNFDMRFDNPSQYIRSHSRLFFAELITQTFLHRSIDTPLQSFNLFFDYIPSRRNQLLVDSWVRRATAAGATFLRLFLNRSEYERDDESDYDPNDDPAESYDFHFSDLVNSSVRVLKILCCSIFWPKNVSANAFSELRSVHLHYVHVHEDVFSAVVSSFVNLEVLSICSLFTLHEFKIH